MSPTHFVNDGTADEPKLRVYLNLDTLLDLRPDSLFEAELLVNPGARDARLAADGFDGVQYTASQPTLSNNHFAFCGADRIDHPCDADAIVARHAESGDLCLTVHVGSGLEDDSAASHLVEATLSASMKHHLPVFIETHRATITQDIWRTVQITKRFPEVRFNGDFSHYYCGQEMVYGNWAAKLALMQPIFDRVGFLHGRVASPGCMQVPIAEKSNGRPVQAHGLADYADHFQQMWACAARGFLAAAQLGDVLIFAPELLSGTHYYARLFANHEGVLVEETDRYAQALLYQRWIRNIFSSVQADNHSLQNF